MSLPEEVRGLPIEVDEAGCWTWVGHTDAYGYGRTGSALGRRYGTRLAHRVVYIMLRGGLQAEMVLDHKCHDPKKCAEGLECPHRRCVNPDHVEPTTRQENSARSSTAHKEECRHGHAFDAENTRVTQWGRRCRKCDRDWKRASRASDANRTGSEIS